ncbi:MAG: EboA domain-containing protein [Lentisphaeraceae bacterium]|nr:EboA domain-containing protein [Lentisphaeraceae bacterium]
MNLCKNLESIARKYSEAAPRNNTFWSSFDTLDDLSLNEFMTLSAAAPRRLGRKTVEFTEEEQNILQGIHPTLTTQTPGNLGRVLLAAKVQSPECVEEMIIRGGDDEQAAVVIALNLRDDAAVYKDKVVHACRTNSTIVHGAVSQDNPYPAKYFDDQAFKQLVIKTIFMGLDFDKITNLESRFNGELGQSLTDFFDERKAAGRWLPDSVLKFMKNKGLLK